MAEKQAAVFGVVSAKGGVGKSVLAANLAVAFLRETKQRVLVMDLDLAYPGDVVQVMGLDSPRRALSDLAPLLGNMAPNLLKGFLDMHPCGVSVLPACHRPEEAAELGEETISSALDLVAQAFDIVVVDLGTGFNAANLACLEHCTHIFMVFAPDNFSLNHTRRGLEQLQGMAFPQNMISLVLNRFNPKGDFTPQNAAARLGREISGIVPEETEDVGDSVACGQPLILSNPKNPFSRALDDLASRLWSAGLMAQPVKLKRPASIRAAAPAPATSMPRPADSLRAPALDADEAKLDAIKLSIHQRLLEEMDLKQMDQLAGSDPQKLQALRADTKKSVDKLVDEEATDIKDRSLRLRLVEEVLNEALGLGPIEALLADDTVTEIMCNGPRMIYVERSGKLELTELRFLAEKQLRNTIERIVAPLGRRIDELSPMVDARLADGSRVNAVIPPLAVDGALLTIRKFARTPLKVKDLINFGSMTDQIAEFLECCVKARLNILISGGTGSGKTTLLNVLSDYIPHTERIVTIEDSAELQLRQRHVCRLESRPPSLEGTGEVSIRDLVRNALRMRPDRIVVGECRGAEALDMLQAMNTGHDGSLTTIHANTPRDSLSRLETLVMFAGLELPSRAIREQVASAIDLVVQQNRLPDGSRKIVQITEVTGMEADVTTMQDIFMYQQTGIDQDGKVKGHFTATGFIPRFMTTLEEKGFSVPREIFMETYT